MPRYRCGTFTIIAPERQLETGEVVELHSHDHFHLTYFLTGITAAYKFDVMHDAEGKPKLDENGRPVEFILRRKERFGPGGFLEMEAACWHRFEVVKGPMMYHCLWPSLDPMSGEAVEYYTGYGVS